jgi:hypothetical protein
MPQKFRIHQYNQQARTQIIWDCKVKRNYLTTTNGHIGALPNHAHQYLTKLLIWVPLRMIIIKIYCGSHQVGTSL